MFNSFSKSIALILSALVISLGLVLIVWAWTEPTQAPPGGNVAAPLNVSGTAQTKSGALTIEGKIIHNLSNYDDIWGKWTTIGIPKNWAGLNSNYYGLLTAWNSDYAFFGLKDYGSDRKDVIIGLEQGGDNFRFQVGGSDKVVINSNGDITSVGAICLDDGCKSNWGEVTGENYWTQSGSDLYPNDTGWNVGIGTTNPTSKLTINQGSSGCWNCGIEFDYDGSNEWLVVADTGNGARLNFGYNSSSKMQLYSNGRLDAVGQMRAPIYYDRNNTGYYVDPASTNRVNYVRANRTRTDNINMDGNEIRFYYSTDSIIRKTAGYLELHGSVNRNSRIWLQDNVDRIYIGDGNTDLRFRGNGRINILYDRNDTSYYVDPAGTSRFNKIKARDFVYISDITLKKSIKPLENSLEKVLNLEGVSFNWKDNDEPSIGLIAQDVEKEFPRAVLTSEGDIKSIDYGRLIAPLIESIKEQQQEIEKLKAEVEELKK